MPGCSGKTLLENLGIRTGHRVRLPNVPIAWPELLKDFSARPPIGLNVILLFVKSSAQFQAEFALWMRSLRSNGMIWGAWPRKALGRKIDLPDQDRFIEHCDPQSRTPNPFVEVKICAIDDTWSDLKLTVRKELRDGWATSTIYGSVPVQ